MADLYEKEYRFIGRHVNFEAGKIVNRDDVAVRKLDGLLLLGESGSLLDIGCGAGSFLAAFANAKRGWTVMGADVGDIHKEKILTIPGARFSSGPDALQKIDERFDLISFNHVVEHLTDPVTTLKEAAALLRPGGRVVIRVPEFSAVNSDFFLIEHCSHFTRETLRQALALAGLGVQSEIEGLSAIEIGYVAKKNPDAPTRMLYQPECIRDRALAALAWAETLPDFIVQSSKGRKAGVFGVGGAGLWLGVRLHGSISFFVDEDPSKQGTRFADCPILKVADIPEDSVVCVTFNNPTASQRMRDRLSATNTKAMFVAPPPV